MENHCSIPFFTTTLTFCLASVSDEVSWKIVREKQIREKQIALSVLAEKTDDVSRCHHGFPHEMTSDRQTSAKIPYWWRVTFKITVVLLIGWKFPSTNQKHYPDLGSDASTVWNFCACFSDVISARGDGVASCRLFSQTTSFRLYTIALEQSARKKSLSHCKICTFLWSCGLP